MRSLTTAHRDELVGQAYDKIRTVIGHEADIGVIKAERNDVDAAHMIASVQTLSRPNRLEQVTPNIDLLVIDEAHHASMEAA